MLFVWWVAIFNFPQGDLGRRSRIRVSNPNARAIDGSFSAHSSLLFSALLLLIRHAL